MGGAVSCKKNKNKGEVNMCDPPKKPRTKAQKPFVLDKDRKIIQKDKELYRVVFDAEGFSVHDLALLGQKNSPDSVIKPGLVPREMGRVKILPDVTHLIDPKKKNAKSTPKSTPSKGKSPKASTPSFGIPGSRSLSKGDFEIVEIQDYVDDLYLQLLEPQMESEDRKESNTSNTDTNMSNK